mgnify:CR=1 FL=1|nr:MAG TPA: hypothetical protein [Caudoviricetes sp.]
MPHKAPALFAWGLYFFCLPFLLGHGLPDLLGNPLRASQFPQALASFDAVCAEHFPDAPDWAIRSARRTIEARFYQC